MKIVWKGEAAMSETAFQVEPRLRVIIDNDFSSDPDGLFQTAHHLLSPSVDVRGIVGSHLRVMGMEGRIPLFLACGAGLTDLASALMMESAIAKRMTLVWIGGNEYPELALPPPTAEGAEYNLDIDVPAA
jgi:purine nucleosidase